MTPSARLMLVTATAVVLAVLLGLAVVTIRGLGVEAQYHERHERVVAMARDLSQIESAFNVSEGAGEPYRQRLFRVVPGRLEALAGRAADAGLGALSRLVRECGEVLARWAAGPVGGSAEEFERHQRSQLLFSLHRASDEAWRIAVEHAGELEAQNRTLTVAFAAGAAVLVVVMLLAMGATYFAAVRPLVRITGRVDRGEPALPGARGPLVAREVRALAAAQDASRAAREASEERLRRAIRHAPLPIVIFAEDGAVLEVNDAWTRITGYRREEMPTIARWVELAYDEDRRAGVLAGIQRLFGEKGPVDEGEFVIRCRDGDRRVWNFFSTPLGSTAEGTRLVEGMAIDTTARREAERAREASENLLREVVDSLSEAVFVVNSRSRVVLMCNRAATDMFGWPEADLVGRETRHLHLDEDHYQEFGRLSRQGLEAGGVFTNTFEMRRANGEVFPTEHEIRPVPSDPRWPEVVVSVVRDVTERVAAERELRASHERLEQRVAERTAALSAANERLKELDRLKSLFIASMSHELRTPLNSVIGFTGLLLMDKEGGLTADQRDYLERIRSSGDHLLNLVTDIIDVSKVEAGKIVPHPVTVAVDELVGDAVAALTPAARGKGLWVRTECALGTTVVTDRRRLTQCLLNLLSNAVKYTEDGGITVRCDAERGGVRFAVTDTGIGIAEEDLPRLWRQFSRIDSATSRSSLGSGLGLYLTWRLARDVLGGEVGVESRPGAGSTFWLWLPAETGREPDPGYNLAAT